MGIGEVGRLIGGRYRLDRTMERGAGTQTLLVTDLRNGRPCVLRQLATAAASAAVARRFEAQAAILAKLNHPGLPRYVDGFSEGEGEAAVRVVIVSYHPGESLERLVAKGRPLTESQALVLLRRVVPVLVYLHAFEPPLVHRTISTTGIILGPDGRPCLTDLDYAVADQEGPTREQSPPGPDELALAAPEVFMGGAVPASDIYALGLVLCRAMTAKDPAVLLREGAKVPLRGALGVSEAFAAVLGRMLEPSLERRYADARALEADLARLAGVRVALPAQPPQPRATEEPQPGRSLRPLVVVGALGLLVLAALAVVRMRTNPAPEVSLLVSPAPHGDAAAPAPADPGGVPPEPSPAPSPTPQPVPPPAVESVPEVPQPSGSPSVPTPPAPTAVPASDSPPAVFEGRLRLDGKPFVSTGTHAPRFWLRNEGTKVVEQPKATVKDDVVTVRDLAPGRYGLSVRIDLNPANPGRFPGDLDAWSQFTVEAGRPVSIEVPLRRIIRLLQPVDTDGVLRGWDAPCGSGSVLPGKVVFAWEPLPGAAVYQARIERIACSRGNASAGTVFSRSTTDSWIKADLPPSAAGECYAFSLTARAGEAPAGIMTTHGATGIGWDYRFTVAGGR